MLFRCNDTVAWTVGAAVSAIMAVRFALTWNIGLLDFWEDSVGIALLIAEGAFLLVWIQWALVKRRA